MSLEPGAQLNHGKPVKPRQAATVIVLRDGIGAGAGGVFNVGSITYVPALLVDDAVSRITRNVLERFLD